MPDDKNKPVRISASQLRGRLRWYLEQTQHNDTVFEIRGWSGIRGYLVPPMVMAGARGEAQESEGDDEQE